MFWRRWRKRREPVSDDPKDTLLRVEKILDDKLDRVEKRVKQLEKAVRKLNEGVRGI